MSNLTQRNEKDRAKALAASKDHILAWYLQENNNQPPTQQCVDSKTYRGLTYWWLEPRIPLTVNPRLVEEALGDSWTLRIEPLP